MDVVASWLASSTTITRSTMPCAITSSYVCRSVRAALYAGMTTTIFLPFSNGGGLSRVAAADEVDHDAGELLAAVLLEEVTGAGDGRMRLPPRAGDRLAEEHVAALRDRIGVAERGEERLLPPAERLPCPAVGGCRRVVGRRWHEQREATRPGLVVLVGKR